MSNEFPTMRWLKETSCYLNATTQEISHTCDSFPDHEQAHECFWKHKYEHNIDFDPWVYSVQRVDKDLFQTLLTTLTDSQVIIVPRFPINTIQLFMMPFKWKLWLTIILLLIGLEIAKLIFSTKFRNDPILLVVCGYERYTLHKARRFEKCLLLYFILLMFFITRAYETKILSFMVSRPATNEIRTLRDLRESGIKIKYDPSAHFFVKQQEELADMLEPSNNNWDEMDQIHGYIAEKRMSESWLLFKSYDHVNKLYRYNVMDQSLGMFSLVYWFSPRNPMVSIFGYTLTVFIESGIFDFWETMSDCELSFNLDLLKELDMNSFISYEDIFPVLVLVSYGFILSVVVIIAEIIVNKLLIKCKKFKRFYHRINHTSI